MATGNTALFDSGHQFSGGGSDTSLSGEIRNSSASEVDLEGGELEGKLHLSGGEVGRDCRICHLGLGRNGRDNGGAIELGCSCKGDLAAAHRKCAETWFKIKGNTICEICGATALNIAGEHATEPHNTAAGAAMTSSLVAPMVLVESRTFWRSHRIVNFLLACMVFAFIVSWLFHLRILS